MLLSWLYISAIKGPEQERKWSENWRNGFKNGRRVPSRIYNLFFEYFRHAIWLVCLFVGLLEINCFFFDSPKYYGRCCNLGYTVAQYYLLYFQVYRYHGLLGWGRVRRSLQLTILYTFYSENMYTMLHNILWRKLVLSFKSSTGVWRVNRG